ncbi:hypothetical protein D3870_13140 [Noviherbaspirillum cavernae]|uniref:PilY1 beta-propeller domain-containing protein n=1 Tax=Noviherbaspirillum cavernae TaxID=2320862 RepID=A0A418X2Z3_9BURK|nr:PilC/PilY family type IV pilus protein [Noviherbaspirillum cavernae]RJG06823.1 hypothetical protein D3870_13140 [Noviherbaspirillum cavernae]
MKPNTGYMDRRCMHTMRAILLTLSSVQSVIALAAVTDLANGPLATGITSANTVKPNIAFVVDDSGSMDDQNMPNDEGTNRGNRCWGSSKYNTLFYDPENTYKPPFKLDGAVYSDGVTRYPDASFTAALKDGYFPANGYTYSGDSSSNTTTNLSTLSNLTPNAVSCSKGVDCPNASVTSTKYYYSRHKTNENAATCEADSNYSIVIDPDKIGAPGMLDGGSTAAKIAAAKTNYANWYTYYRRRAMLMKAATGEAFKDLDEAKYRIGLFFLNSVESGADESTQKNNDLKIADFSGTASGSQRSIWYSRLYGGRDGGYTPLRGALSRMGRMYAGQISGWDPVQYSCQQNFTILSTDGYWNTQAETSSYGPKRIDGSTDVGNQDGAATSAVSARATISISKELGNGKSGCYQFTSVSVNPGTAPIELMNGAAPKECTVDADTLGMAVRDSIKARTGTTGFSAAYNNNVITITAPASLGALTVVPVVTAAKDPNSGAKYRNFPASAFNGGAPATEGAMLPYMDALNISNTLADIGYYYYTTDLRDQVLNNCSNTIGSTTYSNLCENNVRGSDKDSNSKQHMTTFTIGLGVSGTIKYEANYKDAQNVTGVTQYYDIVNGSANWPNPNTELTKIDDLWHAAVNGRAMYYSATNAKTLKDGIQSALAGIQSSKGSSAAAATSNLEPVAGDNFVYVALYQTLKWDGDLTAYSMDPGTGALSGVPLWSAQAQLDAQVNAAETAAAPGDGRTIKFFSAGATNKLKDFTLTDLTADGLNSHFENICSKTPAIAQCGSNGDSLSTDQKALANNGDNLVNYLRGRSVYEDEAVNATTINRIYRGRDHVLGDIVNAVPVYMKKPPFSYDTFDTTYATFKTNNVNRAATVFVAANDGMLHAFNADGNSTQKGRERWAYVPTFVMSKMWRLADRNYADNHQYLVDGSPTLADICTTFSTDNPQVCAATSNWKTILVGGLNKGGCGYYALDVTDPAAPKGLWEFSNPNLGYSFGNPVVVKRKDGRWVVIFSSGYNNYPGNGCGNTGDGNGHVFVVDAVTGQLLDDIPTYTTGTTPAGTTDTPSGLGKLAGWVENVSLPIADRLYGGDLRGNMWRIDFDNNHAPAGKEAVLLAQLKDGGNNRQPVTVKPQLAVAGTSGAQQPIVMVGTGRYLGEADLTDTSQQSVYALKDSLGTTGIANVRGSTMVSRTLTQTSGSNEKELAGRTIRTVSGDAINWASNDGWYLDFNPNNASPGERVNVDMSMQLNTLTLAANVPANSVCNDAGGYAFLYFLDINTGMNLSLSTDGMAGLRLSSNALVAGIRTVRLINGRTVTIITDTAGNVSSEVNPSNLGGGINARRTTWREIPD